MKKYFCLFNILALNCNPIFFLLYLFSSKSHKCSFSICLHTKFRTVDYIGRFCLCCILPFWFVSIAAFFYRLMVLIKPICHKMINAWYMQSKFINKNRTVLKINQDKTLSQTYCLFLKCFSSRQEEITKLMAN